MHIGVVLLFSLLMGLCGCGCVWVCTQVCMQSFILCSDVFVYVLLGMRYGDSLQGPVQLVRNSTVGQYQVTLHHCTQTAVEQLFLITEQSLWIPTSANLLCVCVHVTFQCLGVHAQKGVGFQALVSRCVLYLQGNSVSPSSLMSVCAQTARSAWLRQTGRKL